MRLNLERPAPLRTATDVERPGAFADASRNPPLATSLVRGAPSLALRGVAETERLREGGIPAKVQPWSTEGAMLVSVRAADTHLSRLIEAVERGERVVITRRGTPAAPALDGAGCCTLPPTAA